MSQFVTETIDPLNIEKLLYLQAPKELGAHIQRNQSTGEYYRYTKYEPLTLSQLGDRAISIICSFSHKSLI